MPSIIPKITINGKESTEISGLMIVALPPITKPAMRAVAEEIDGRDGDQIEKLGFSAYDKTIRIALSGDYDVDDVIEYFNQDGIITFSNEPDKYYHFKQLEGIDFEKLMRYKTADVVFHCQPFKFSTTEEEKIFSNPESVNITNSGNYFSKPEIVLTGKGNMEMSINDAPVLAIDFGDEEQTIAIDAQSMNAYGTKNNIKEAIFEINPSQDLHGYESAWLDSETPFKKPYNLINVAGTASRIGNSMIDKIVGGSFAFNQLINGGDFSDASLWGKINLNLTVANNVGTAIKTAENGYITKVISVIAGHKYLRKLEFKGVNGVEYTFNGQFPTTNGSGEWIELSKVVDIATSSNQYLVMRNNETSNFQPFYLKNIFYIDLTQMLGSTIADYIYSLEQATAGAGVAYFRALFPDDYYPYNAGELLSVKTSAHIMRNASNAILANYPLDANLELRGIPQIDASGNLSYDGDEYTADGNVLRKYGIVDLGSIAWVYQGIGNDGGYVFGASQAFLRANNAKGISLLLVKNQSGWKSTEINTINMGHSSVTIFSSHATISSPDDFKTAMNGIMLIYEKETATTETAQPFASPQIVDASGSMEYVDARAVKIPAGHVSMYANNCEILGFTESNVSKAGANLMPQIQPQSTSLFGITCIIDEDGTISLNGTSTASGSIILAENPDGILKIPDGLYLHYFNNFASSLIALVIEYKDGTNFAPAFNAVNRIIPVPQSDAGKIITKIRLYFISGLSLSNAKTSPMLSLSDDAVPYADSIIKSIPVAWAVNQWDGEKTDNVGVSAQTGNLYASEGVFTTDYMRILPDAEYYASPNNWKTWACFYDENKNYIGYSNITNGILKTAKNAYYMRISGEMGNVETASINYPSSDHNYHAYSGIPTAYKAQLIFLDGTWELRLLSKKINMGSLSWEKFDVAQGSLFRSNEIDVKKIQSATEIPNVLCGLYPTVSNAQRANHSLSMENNMAKIDVIDDGFDDVASFKTAMKNIDLEYEMQSPVSVSLSADELTSLLGINNIWHDANGETQIRFTKDGDVEHETSGLIATFYIDVDDIVFGVFKNRLIIGDYDKIQLKKGSNTISFAPIDEGSEISNMAIDFYSRWL